MHHATWSCYRGILAIGITSKGDVSFTLLPLYPQGKHRLYCLPTRLFGAQCVSAHSNRVKISANVSNRSYDFVNLKLAQSVLQKLLLIGPTMYCHSNEIHELRQATENRN